MIRLRNEKKWRCKVKTALIIGAFGQDGKILTELLEQEGYSIIKIGRNSLALVGPNSVSQDFRIESQEDVDKLIERTKPSEVYYLAATHGSAEQVAKNDSQLFRNSYDVHVIGILNVLHAIKKHCPDTRTFYASSSLIFGDQFGVINEKTEFKPRCPYGVTKLAGVNVCQYFRENYRLFVSIGHLFNHESEYRNAGFIFPKIIDSAIEASRGSEKRTSIGDLNASVDWGCAHDFVRAMKLILNSKKSGDFIIATGETNTVESLANTAFNYFGLNFRDYLYQDPKLSLRKNSQKCGDASLLKEMTGWSPSKNFTELVNSIIKSRLDITSLK
jgi:GDPmannose 4,6-dehydratase